MFWLLTAMDNAKDLKNETMKMTDAGPFVKWSARGNPLNKGGEIFFVQPG